MGVRFPPRAQSKSAGFYTYHGKHNMNIFSKSPDNRRPGLEGVPDPMERRDPDEEEFFKDEETFFKVLRGESSLLCEEFPELKSFIEGTKAHKYRVEVDYKLSPGEGHHPHFEKREITFVDSEDESRRFTLGGEEVIGVLEMFREDKPLVVRRFEESLVKKAIEREKALIQKLESQAANLKSKSGVAGDADRLEMKIKSIKNNIALLKDYIRHVKDYDTTT